MTDSSTPESAANGAVPSRPLPMKRPFDGKTRFAGFRTIVALMMREMATSYGRSPGGYLWEFLEPLAGIAILSAAFSLAFRNPAIGTCFPLFYATGVIPLSLYNETSAKISFSLNYSKQLLSYPRVTFIDAILARFILNMITEFMVTFLIFAGIMYFFDTRVILDIPVMASAILLAGAFGLGIGTLNSFMFTQFPLWQRLWGILMRPLFFVSCVFNIFDSIPDSIRGYFWYNPIVHIIGLMRRGVYSTYDAPYVSVSYVLSIAATSFVLGIVLLRRYYRDMLNK